MLLLALSCSLFATGCNEGTAASPIDAGADFTLAPQVTHVGVTATTCCIVANTANQTILYLARPKPAPANARGIDQPARGELHVANPYGVDFVLASDVPAGGYDFAPNGQYAMFIQLVPGLDEYSLNFATLTSPELKKPNIIKPIADGMFSRPINAQSFVTPSGRFLIAGSRNPVMNNSPDLHVIELATGKNVFKLGNGAYSYIEIVTQSDVMFYQYAVGSVTPGIPTVQGLYAVSLDAAIYSNVTPALIDERTAQVSLHADDHSLLYTRTNGELVLYDMRDQTKVTLASNVVSFTLGPQRRGPLAYISNDSVLHVRPLLNEETVTTAPGSIDVNSVMRFSPDGQHLYFFRNYREQDRAGDLWHVGLPPSGTGAPSLISGGASNRVLVFERDRMIYANDVSITGEIGTLLTAAFDGSGATPLSHGVTLATLEQARPLPAQSPPPEGIDYGPLDMAPPFTPQVIAHLTESAVDPDHELSDRPIDETRPLIGTLSLARSVSGPVLPLALNVHTGKYRFSDDGLLLFYAANVAWDSTAHNFIGDLRLQSATGQMVPPPSSLTGVSELGPIRDRSLYVNAPNASTGAGVYFIKY